jgi:release factor glutamine methyltransferase
VSTLAQLLAAARTRLAEAGIEQPGREAALLLGHLLGMSEAAVLAHRSETAPPETVARYSAKVARRAAGAPFAYVSGSREFWGRRFRVDERVLVPRPETEHLVEIALALALPRQARVLDVGTGSGCLAVTLAAERPGWRLLACDVSPAALAVARRNAAEHGVAERIAFFACDLVTAVRAESIALLVANLPYVDPAAPLDDGVRLHEPPGALFAADRGLALLARLLDEARALPSDARLVLEIGSDQAGPLLERAARTGAWDPAEIRHDLAGHARVVVFRRAHLRTAPHSS